MPANVPVAVPFSDALFAGAEVAADVPLNCPPEMEPSSDTEFHGSFSPSKPVTTMFVRLPAMVPLPKFACNEASPDRW